MPPKKDYVVDDNHPFIVFEPITNTYTDTETKEERTVVVGYEPQLEGGLTAEILETGNLGVLMDFWEKNEDKLTDNEKKYMQARSKAATEVENLRTKALSDIAEGKVTQGPEPDETGGYIGFSGLKSPGVQTSGNGCWSVAYSMLLKSRGVDIDQAQIRGWRPDRTKDDSPEPQLGAGAAKARNSASAKMNTDTVNSIDEMSDLLMQVLPNTSMSTATMNPLVLSDIKVDGRELDPGNQADQEAILAINKEYDAQAEEFLRSTINRAIKEDHSPVALMHKGHYMTITGISPDGKMVRCEDSQGSKENLTKEIPISQIIKDSLHARVVNNRVIPPGGFKLTWLHDLKMPEYSKRQEQSPSISTADANYASIDESGKITVDVPAKDPANNNYGNKNLGQLEGKGINYPVAMDMKKLSDALGGKNVECVTGLNGKYRMGDYDTYYPKKAYYGKDPALIQELQAAVNKQSQPHQFDSDFLNTFNSLKQKLAFSEKQQSNPQVVKGVLTEDVNKLTGMISNDPYLKKEFFDASFGNNFNVNPYLATKNLVDKIDNVFGISASMDPQQQRKNFQNMMDNANYVLQRQNSQPQTQPVTQPETPPQQLVDEGTMYINQRWAELSNPQRNYSAQEKQQLLAEILAISEIGARQRVKGIKQPVYNENEYTQLTQRILNDEAFNRLVADGNDANIIRAKDTKKLVSGLAQTIKDLNYEKKFDISGREALVQKRRPPEQVPIPISESRDRVTIRNMKKHLMQSGMLQRAEANPRQRLKNQLIL